MASVHLWICQSDPPLERRYSRVRFLGFFFGLGVDGAACDSVPELVSEALESERDAFLPFFSLKFVNAS